MPNKNDSAKKKVVKVRETRETTVRTYNPTKSKAGRIILIILVTGMFLGMLIAAIYGMISVLS